MRQLLGLCTARIACGLISIGGATLADLAASAAPPTLGAVAQAKGPPNKAVDPIVMAMFDQMGSFLRSLPYFRLSARTTTDVVMDNGQKIQSSGLVQIFVRRPDRLRIDISSDEMQRQLFYDGKTFTQFGTDSGYYAQFAAPPTIAEVVDALEKKYGIEIPLADLFYWGTDRFDTKQIRSATDIGPSKVEGQDCRHFAFRQRDVDWQVWVAEGRRPLPLKIVVTTRTTTAHPEHSSVLTWELDTRPPDSVFEFIAPAGAHRIEFQTMKQGGATR
jgi:hypothetical protein